MIGKLALKSRNLALEMRKFLKSTRRGGSKYKEA